MELPHFTLFYRRLLRQSGRGQVLIALYWLVVSVLGTPLQYANWLLVPAKLWLLSLWWQLTLSLLHRSRRAARVA